MCMSDWSSAVCSSDLERGAAHAFRPAGDDEVGIAAADRPRRHGNSVHAGAAEAIERDAARRVGKAGEQPGHAGEVAIVLAGLVGAAEDDVVAVGPVHTRLAVDQRLDRDGGEIVGADMAERTALAADRGAGGESGGAYA